MKFKKLLCMLVLCSFSFCAVAQGKLNQAKSDLSSKSSSRSSSSSDSRSSADDDDEGIFDSFFTEFFFYLSYGTLFGEMESRNLTSYPYASGTFGEYHAYEDVNTAAKRSQFIISNTVVWHESNFYGNDLQLNYRMTPLLGIQASHLHFFERGLDNTDLGMSSLMLNYYRIREKHVTGYWGIGGTYLGSGIDDFGFSYQVGLDIYPVKPFSIGLLWKQTFVNSSAVDEFSILGKYHMKKTAIQAGFKYYELGTVSLPSAALGVEFRL